MSERGKTFMEAAEESRKIADRLRGQADRSTGDDRNLKIAMSAGARLIAVRLTELADWADVDAKQQAPDRPTHPYDGCGACITWREWEIKQGTTGFAPNPPGVPDGQA